METLRDNLKNNKCFKCGKEDTAFLEEFNDENGEAEMKCCVCGHSFIRWKV